MGESRPTAATAPMAAPASAAGRVLRTEIAVVGAGPAGIAAASRAAEAGRDVVVLDAAPRPGGQIWRHRRREELPAQARAWLERFDRSGARLIAGAQVVDAWRAADAGGDAGSGGGAPEGFRLLAEVDGERLEVAADRVILATGARELFLPFPGWTLPNVFGVGGAQALLKAGASFAGKRVVVAGSGPLLLAVGATLASKGARVTVVAEQAGRAALARFGVALLGSPGRILQAARLRSQLGGARYAIGWWVTRADGDGAVREVTLTDGRRSWTEPCDVLCTGYGLAPNTELAEMLGCVVDGGRVRVDEWQRTSIAGVYCAGEPTGIAGVDAALAEGEIAGGHAAEAMGTADPPAAPGGAAGTGRTDGYRRLFAIRRREHRVARAMERAFAPRAELRDLPRDDTILCRCEDVTRGMVDPAWSFRQAKLYTRIGMGPCQARVCGPACEFLFGWRGQTTRAPTAPAAIATIAVGPQDAAAGS